MIITYKYRIKDSTSGKYLDRMASSINYVWNYCNETSYNQARLGNWLSNYDLHKLTSGCSKELGINSTAIQAVCDEYVTRRRQHKKIKLKWRSYKRSLGWIPFKGSSISNLGNGRFKHNGIVFKFWQSRDVGKIKCGSFNKDSQGRWYVNFVCELTQPILPKTNKAVGVDLGLKETATYSDGDSFVGEKPTRKYAEKLAKAQRARKRKRVSKIHAKIKNIRKDSIHKETTRILNKYDKVVVGDVSSKKLVKTKMAKSVHDVSWGIYKSQLEYKAIKLGREVKVVNESWTSRTCSGCGTIQNWSGLSGLSVREFECIGCGDTHNRDVNAAKNILSLSPYGAS